MLHIARWSFLLLVAVSSAMATDWCVDASAPGPGQGTQVAPFSTVQAGVNASRPGDRVLVRGGIYREQITVSKTATSVAPIIITAYPGERPVVTGSVAVTGWRLDHGSIWRRDSWTNDSQQVFVDGAPLQQIGMPAGLGTGVGSDGTVMLTAIGTDATSMAAGNFYVDRAAAVLYVWLTDSGDPNQHALEASVQRRLLAMNGSAWVTVSGLSFQHTSATAFGSTGAAVELGNWCTLRDCDVQWCDFGGVAMGYLQQGSQAINVTARNNGCLGFSASGSSGFLISGCTIAGNNYRRFNTNWQAGGAKIASKAWGSFIGCDVVGNLGQGIWFDYANSGNPIVVSGCRIRDNLNLASGIMVEVSNQISIHNNLISGNTRRGIYIAASDNVDVAGNTVTGNQGMYAIDVSGMPRTGATLTNIRIRNNLVIDNQGTIDLFLVRENGTDISNLVSDHNLFQRAGGDVALWSGGDGRSGWRGTTYTSLAAWQAATAQDAHSLQVDPHCLDRAHGDYHLLVGSPAIDAGDAVPFATDFAGVARTVGAAPDIGALENWAPVVSSTHLDGAAGRSLRASIVASNAPTEYACSALPAGLTFDSASGVISGFPVVGGLYSIAVTATNGGGTGAGPLTLSIDSAPVLLGGPVPDVAVVVGSCCHVSVVCTDDGGADALIYHWSSPDDSVAFSANSTTSAASVTATFSHVGTYPIAVTVTDAQGLSTTGTMSVTVAPVASALVVSPTTASIPLLGLQSFAVSATDQFGMAMVAPPMHWTVDGGGAIDGNGVFRAGVVPCPVTITAACGTVSASALEQVINTPPRLVTTPWATSNGTIITLDVEADDDAGIASLTYAWSAINYPAQAHVVLSTTNGVTSATVSSAGSYTFSVAVTDAGGLAVTGSVTVTVVAVAADILVSPTVTTLIGGSQTAFTAIVRDQFGQPLVLQPTIAWSTSSIGTVSVDGRFTAAVIPASGMVTARAAGLVATAQVTVTRPLFAAHINFQPASAPLVPGYVVDAGQPYADRGNGVVYGWNAPCESRDRNAIADQRLDTQVLMQAPSNPAAVWEVAVPAGTYQVQVTCGDPAYFDGNFALLVEGALTVSGRATSVVPFRQGSITVRVSDGRLTLSNSVGSYNTKICYIDIQEMPVGDG